MPAFWIGLAMIAYDASGHAMCLMARLSGQRGVDLWNSYSRYVWPAVNGVWYDAYWAAWFAVAIALILIGHFAPAKWRPDSYLFIKP